MKVRNYYLIIGSILIGFLLFIFIFAEQLAPMDPYTLNLGGEFDGEYLRPPFPPGGVYKLGTDVIGRDILSRLLYGAKTTLKITLLSTLFKFIIALPIAFFAAYNSKVASALIRFFKNLFTAIPALIISLFILSIPPIRMLELDQAIIAFVIVIGFVGWGRLGHSLEEKIKDILSMNFIQGEIAIGKNRFQIAFQNVMPHLIPFLIVYFFLECGRSLLLVAQIGLFGIYVGRNKLGEIVQDLGLAVTPTFYPEWGGMIASGRGALPHVFWIALFPSIAFFLSILGFNMFGEGLRIEVEKRNSMILTWIKRVGYHLSPKTIYHQIKNYKENKRVLQVKGAVLIGIIIMAYIITPKPQPKIDIAEIQEYLEFQQDNTQDDDSTIDYIISELEQFNVKPLFENTYIQEYQPNTNIIYLDDAKLTINDGNTLLTTYTLGNEFMYRDTIIDVENLSGLIISRTEFEKGNYDPDKKYFVYIDYIEEDYNQKMIETIFKRFASEVCVNGIIAPTELSNIPKGMPIALQSYSDYNEQQQEKGAKLSFKPFLILVDPSLSKELLNYSGKELMVENSLSVDQAKGITIGGYIEGRSDEDPLILVSNYNKLGAYNNGKYIGLSHNALSAGTALEIAQELSVTDKKPNRDVIFVFMDGSQTNTNGEKQFAKFVEAAYDTEPFVIGLNYMGIDKDTIIFIDDAKVLPTDETNKRFINEMIKDGKKYDVRFLQELLIKKYHGYYYLIGQNKGFFVETGVSTPVVTYDDKINDPLINQTQVILDLIKKMIN